MDANIEVVEHIYKDADMAITSLEKLLKELKDRDNKIKSTVENILKGYERYLKDAKKILEKCDAKKEKNGMMEKMMSTVGICQIVKKDNSDAKIADMLIKGISMGSIDMEKKLKEYENELDKKTVKLAKDFISFQQDNIEALKEHL